MAAIACQRCGETKPGLGAPPLPGKWGPIVAAQTCSDCWREWIEEQTRLINHEHLLPSQAADRAVLYDRMSSFLKLQN